jgi:hypothetical protein
MRIAVYALQKRVSELTALIFASAICRVAAAISRCVVSREGAIVSRLTPTRFFRLILVSNQKDFRIGS